MRRIALVGNMNNNFLAMMKWLRYYGYDAHLYYRVPAWFYPKEDTLDLNYLSFCHEIYWLEEGFKPVRFNVSEIQKLFGGFDKIIAQGDEAAVLNYCGIPIDIYFPYGTDLSKYALQPHAFSLWQKLRIIIRKNSGYRLKDIFRGTPAKYLFHAIQNARYVFMDCTNDDFEGVLKQFRLNGKLEYVPMPFLYYPEYEKAFSGSGKVSVHWQQDMDQLREENDFIVLYHGRQYWKKIITDFSRKENDQLIRGFALFLKHINYNSKVKLVMLEYGSDVAASKELVKELGIETNVFWFPAMSRKDIMYLISKVDVGSGEFGRSYLTFGTIIECMIMGKPVIHYRQDDLYTARYPELYPLINVKYADDIAEKLTYYYYHRSELDEMGRQARQWVQKYFIELPLKRIMEVLNE